MSKGESKESEGWKTFGQVSQWLLIMVAIVQSPDPTAAYLLPMVVCLFRQLPRRTLVNLNEKEMLD